MKREAWHITASGGAVAWGKRYDPPRRRYTITSRSEVTRLSDGAYAVWAPR